MPAPAHLEARPRTTGEILDDAFRAYRADAPLLLTATGLFLVPAFCALLVLLGQPFPDPGPLSFIWAALAALLLPLTGLGAGACEEAFHLRTEGEPVTLARCLRAARRRWLNHLAAEALVLLLPLLAVLCLVGDMPPAVRGFLAVLLLLLNVPVWVVALPRHAVLTAGQRNLWRALRLARRGVGRHPGKAWTLAAARPLLLALVAVNLYVTLRLALWAAEDLAGLDMALPRLLLSPTNPVFLFVLLALTWWLLAPFHEACSYLFLVDARTRYEGLDLWYQIDQLFPAARAAPPSDKETRTQGDKEKKPALLCLLVSLSPCLLVCWLTGRAAADPERAVPKRVHAVQDARREVADILKDVQETEPYPGGKQWREPLRAAGRHLDPEGDARHGRYRWFFQSADRLGRGDRAADVKLLRDLEARLAGIEESLKWQPRQGQEAAARAPPPEDIRKLVPPGGETPAPRKAEKERPKEKEPPVEQEGPRVPARHVPDVGVGSALGPLMSGLGYLCLLTCLVLLVAVVVVGLALLVRSWARNRARAGPVEQGVSEPGAQDYLEEPDRQNVATLWRQADELARAGRFLDAVRTLYLAVLALLHQSGLIRYERTRTNGEYADHLRRRGSPVHRPFLGLTGLFELKWYGQRTCQAGDYQSCRGLAETIEEGVRGRGPGARGEGEDPSRDPRPSPP